MGRAGGEQIFAPTVIGLLDSVQVCRLANNAAACVRRVM